jgi:hypothetical protein
MRPGSRSSAWREGSTMDHLVFVRPATARLIAIGRQICESRLATRRPPAWTARDGDRLFFKVSGGDGVLTARAKLVDRYANLRPDDIDALAELYGSAVDGPVPDIAYWRSKRASNYAVFLWLADVRTWHYPKARLPSTMAAWVAGWSPEATR